MGDHHESTAKTFLKKKTPQFFGSPTTRKNPNNDDWNFGAKEGREMEPLIGHI